MHKLFVIEAWTSSFLTFAKIHVLTEKNWVTFIELIMTIRYERFFFSHLRMKFCRSLTS